MTGKTGEQAAIELTGLTKQYHHGKQPLTAVDNVTLTVSAGQVTGLLGPNGAGKTTLIKMIAGLVLPTAGVVRIYGHDVNRRRSAAVQQIGAVLEGSRNVYWPLSAWENLLYFGRLKGLSAHEVKPRAKRLLSELDLWDVRNKSVGSFSRGMQQKVAIAAALITDPPVILLDEPTIGLDVEAARIVKEWVAHLAHDEGKSVVLTTHQLASAEELSGRIVVIRKGTIIADLPTGDLLNQYTNDHFEVTVAGDLDGLAVQFEAGVRVETRDKATCISLPDTSQDGLYQLFGQLRARHIPVLSVSQGRPDLEEVFVRIIHGSSAAAAVAAHSAEGRERVA